jgi:hypothetical protein
VQVLSRHCLNNRDSIAEQEQARATEVFFFNSDYIANVQGERAESARLAFELQQARHINAQFSDLQQEIEHARQQSNALLQVLSRGYLDDIIASLSLSLSPSLSLSLSPSLSLSVPRARSLFL